MTLASFSIILSSIAIAVTWINWYGWRTHRLRLDRLSAAYRAALEVIQDQNAQINDMKERWLEPTEDQ